MTIRAQLRARMAILNPEPPATRYAPNESHAKPHKSQSKEANLT